MSRTRHELEAEIRSLRAQLERSRRADSQPARRWDDVFEHIQGGCAVHEIVLDERGEPVDYRFLATNAAFGTLTGLDAEGVIGKTVREVLPAIESSWIEKFGKVALTGIPMHFQQHSGPLQREYECIAFSPEHGKFIVVFDDVTERIRVGRQLRQAQKMEAVGQLAGGIAHDFRNILTIVLALGESVRDDLPSNATALRDDLDEILAAAARGTEITHKLLGFSRVEQLAPQRVDLAKVVEDVAGILRRLLPASVRLDVNVPPEISVRADPNALHHILVNLANNARDAMPDGGELRLSSDGTPAHRGNAGPFHCLCVRDDGSGMDQTTLEQMFDPFFTTKPTGHGTGLGMPMVYSLMREQGGQIDVRSEPGQGTEVLLYLPVHAAAAAERPVDPQRALPTGTETILFAEDELALLGAAQRGLSRLGYRVFPAHDGAEALRLFHEHEAEIDLVISDSVMPRLGGADVYDALKVRQPPIRFLMASGYSPGAGLRDRPSIAVPFLRKPYTLTELAQRVREVLDSGNGEVTAVAVRDTV